MLTLLETRGKIHMSEAGLYPACRSRAEVLGFHMNGVGEFSLDAAARPRLCVKCMEILGVTVSDDSLPAPENEG